MPLLSTSASPAVPVPSEPLRTRHSTPAILFQSRPFLSILNTSFLACLDPPHLYVTVRTRPHLNAPRLPYLIDPIRDFPNPTMTRPNSPCLPCLHNPHRAAALHTPCLNLSGHAVPRHIDPVLPPQSLPDPDARRQSASAIPCLLILASPVPFSPVHIIPRLPNRAF